MRRIAKWTGIGLTALIAVFLATTKIVHSSWNHERAGRTISKWISSSLKGEGGPTHQAFTFGRVDYPWLGAVRSLLGGRPVRFEAHEIHIWDPEGHEVLYASRVEAGLRLNRLVAAKIRGLFGKPDLELYFVDSVVDEVRCRIAPGKDGVVNIIAAFTARVPHPSRGGMVITVERSVIRDGHFRIHFPAWSAQIDDFKMQNDSLRYSSFHDEQREDSPAFTYKVSRVEAPKGLVSVGERTFPLTHLVSTEFRAEEPRREDMVLNGTARTEGATVSGHGRLTEVYTKKRGVDLQVTAEHGGEILKTLPSKAYLSGDVGGTAHIHGPFTDVVIEGEAHGADAKVASVDIRQIAAQYRLEHSAVAVKHMTSNVAGGHVRGDGELDWKAKHWNADLELDGIKTAQLGKLAPLDAIAYLLGIPLVVFRAGKKDDSTEHFHIKGIDLTLYRRATEPLPHRVTLDGHL